MKILIAEDDPVSAAALEGLLTRHGHEITVTRDGLEAWQALQREMFPLVVLDWMMPRMDGLQVCRNIREQLPKPYRCILMLTAKQEREDRAQALSAGVDVFLTKPLNSEEIIARLQVAERILKMEQ